ncbi:alpha/beta fold hydrolase [Aromatoleum aromaticum]|uniref:alpha/beta fold hydrolase n=1 Tax=Aromatoleum aromaticum TaxID=551760 RepID=UPI0014593CCD|nr:alpha/beta hydrolase [Aromatoleum aromaticum]NMG56255.1 alpha/beta fold hydrolase [Aromatoleum aromaticum]
MKTWVFLRGLTRESGHWGGFLETFACIVPDSRIVALDLPGTGARHRETSPGDVPRIAEDCRSTLFRLGVDPPYRLLALSLGAMVALAWADRHPAEIAECVLINTSLRTYSPFYRRLRPRSYARLLYLALRDDARACETMILRLTSGQRDERLVDEWVTLRVRHPVTLANAVRQLFAAARYRPPRDRPAPPVLVLASRNDRLVHVACSKAIAAAWNCSLRIHPYAGHDLPLDDGAWVAEQVRHWTDGGGA